jgi:UDP-2,4-diacetamido-2,4,6-trideoxy-beta-L-altropyranose hydrolase
VNGRPGHQPGAILLRRATANDADLLLNWANEPAARAASLSPDPIDRPTHLRWLAARLSDPGCRIWIGANPAGEPVGVIRFETEPDGRAAVSISVAAAARGRGLGRRLLAAGIAAARTDLRPDGFRARVRVANGASIALFHGAGFRPDPVTAPRAGSQVVDLLLGSR